MEIIKCMRVSLMSAIVGLVLVMQLSVPAYSQDSEEYKLFITGFKAYQGNDFQTTIDSMSQVLKNCPDTSLRDMALFWLAHAYYKTGNNKEAAKYMSLFFRENPKSPMKETVEPQLAKLALNYEKTEPAVPAREKAAPEKPAAVATTPPPTVTPAEKPAVAKPVNPSGNVSIAKKKELPGNCEAEILREKAIAEYKAVIDRFPGSSAAASAIARLKELGVVYPVTGKNEAAAAPQQPRKNVQTLNLEIEQFADAEFSFLPFAQNQETGKRVAVPFEIINHGNGKDSFNLESGFPAEFNAQFTAAGAADKPIHATPALAPGEKFKGALNITIPKSAVDGQKISYTVKLASQFDKEVTRSREVYMVASAPLLRMVIKPDKTALLPGETLSYKIALLNIGTSPTHMVTFRINCPPQLESLNYAAAGFKQEGKDTLVLDGVQINSGESKEYTLTFQLKGEAPAGLELVCRAELFDKELKTREAALSTATVVQAISGVEARVKSERLVVIPGQRVTIPITVNNTGNTRESFILKASLPGDVSCSFYQDLNRDGIRQANEPAITAIGPLSPHEEAGVIMELATAASSADGTNAVIGVTLEPEKNKANSTSTAVQLVFSRPEIELAMIGKTGKLKPGDISSFELTCVNRGSSPAKMVEVQSIFPAQMELVASEPAYSRGNNGEYIWKFEEMGSGEKKIIKINYVVKSGTTAGTSLQIKNLLKYQDQIGNRY
jgi:uncharacterized membrane protein